MVNNDVTFNVKVTMDKRWVDYFCSMLKLMEYDGQIGHSERIAFYSDGDGDYNPKFEIDIDYKTVEGTDRVLKAPNNYYPIHETEFDAG